MTVDRVAQRGLVAGPIAAELVSRFAEAGLPGRTYQFEHTCHSGLWGDSVRLSGTCDGEAFEVRYDGWAVLWSSCAHGAELRALVECVLRAAGHDPEHSPVAQLLVATTTPAAAGQPWLEITSPDGTRRAIAIGIQPLVIGRLPGNDVVVPERMVSRRHAQVRREGAKVLLEDVASMGGMYLRGDRITSVVLAPGDSFQVGTTEFRLLVR